jgi:phytoene dehydrogenase-like protein
VYDVIVVGGGLSGGLPRAAYLQKARLEVLIIEANSELGCFCCTHEMWPGTLDSPHVGVSFAGNSPVIEDLDPERTAQNFAKHSERGWW